MNQNTLLAALTVAVALMFIGLVLLGGYFYLKLQKQPETVATMTTETPAGATPRAQGEGQEVAIYFLSPVDLKLVPEKRQLLTSFLPEEIAAQVVQELIAGPDSKDLVRTVPEASKLEAKFYDGTTHTLYLDLNDDFYREQPGHTLAEWAAMYSVVDSCCAAAKEIKQVVFLRAGREVEISPNNLDWNAPVQPDTTWVRFQTAQ